MKNFKYKVLISILVFVVVAVGTIILTRVAEEEKPVKSVMSAAALPVVLPMPSLRWRAAPITLRRTTVPIPSTEASTASTIRFGR